jgi:ABC-type transport system substrate-binding protein
MHYYEAAVEQDEAKRNAIYLQLQEIAAEDAMVVLYGTLAEDAVIRPNVHGFYMPPDYMATRFHQVYLTEE